MFANEEFIEASRKFVCIRIETFESEESEKMVRSLLNGRLANTSFCIFDPQGEQRLTHPSRGPKHMTRRRGGSDDNDQIVIREMNRIAATYRPSESDDPVVMQDFDTFRHALNVASADQRLLLLVTSENDETKANLRTALAGQEMVGRFHTDFLDAKADKNWKELLEGESKNPGIVIVRSGKFGLAGEVLHELAEKTGAEEIAAALTQANETFASLEKRKNYQNHVAEGRWHGIYFENKIPYGEDKDGDGKYDQRLRGRR